MKIVPIILWFGCFFWAGLCSAQLLYNEEYRPQYHFSPSAGWIGDPDGLIRYQDKYHLFWWGHAESNDLVNWSQKPYPMRGGDNSFQYFTGSVVVDKDNTSGLGDGVTPPMVAIYTAHNNASKIQNQRISYSTDYTYFDYYQGNPVLDIGSTEFRDPDVFWHKETNRWIMCITMPVDRRIDFYSSADLKTWKYLSSFGGVGAREQVWEVPHLVSLAVDGDVNNRKWVMICSLGPNKVQYFPGEFDGTAFVLDAESSRWLQEGAGIDGDVFESFEDSYEGWTVEGEAFGNYPAQGALPGQGNVTGYLGNSLINSYRNGDGAVGRITSSVFTIVRNHINFLIGGGNSEGTTITLLVDGAVVRTATGHNSEALKWKGWDVSALKGKEARIVVTDNQTSSWGHINVDHIMFSDHSWNFDREHAFWVDYGADFYAARSFRDYDNDNGSSPVAWIGWMSNWEYANDTPTSWGRGIQSIPRELELRTVNGRYQLHQQPLPELQSLRGEVTATGMRSFTGSVPVPGFVADRNTYELEAVFEISDPTQNVGLNLFKSAAGRVILGYDARTSLVYLDRRYSGNTTFNPSFPRISVAPLSGNPAEVKFHIFVDQSSIEVFVNDGAVVLSSLIFPYSNSNGIEIFSKDRPATLKYLNAWDLSSIWGVAPPSPVTAAETSVSDQTRLHVYPNPVSGSHETINIDFTGEGYNGQPVCIRILDSKGALVLASKRYVTDNRINVNPVPGAGLYIVHVKVGEKWYQEKIVIK